MQRSLATEDTEDTEEIGGVRSFLRVARTARFGYGFGLRELPERNFVGAARESM
jgi:hypothetical protein